jgi:hypothetical protein
MPNLSAIDLLLNCGPESRRILFGDTLSAPGREPAAMEDAGGAVGAGGAR